MSQEDQLKYKFIPPVEGGKWNLKLDELLTALHQATKTLASHE